MPITETFHGFIESTTDTLLVFEACRQGILPKINRRLQERERGAVKSGTVFVFDEKESGKRKKKKKKKDLLIYLLLDICRHQEMDRWFSLESLTYSW